MKDLIVTGIIFIIAIALLFVWQPTRLLLIEIFRHPFKESVFAITNRSNKVKKVRDKKPKNSNDRETKETGNVIGAI